VVVLDVEHVLVARQHAHHRMQPVPGDPLVAPRRVGVGALVRGQHPHAQPARPPLVLVEGNARAAVDGHVKEDARDAPHLAPQGQREGGLLHAVARQHQNCNVGRGAVGLCGGPPQRLRRWHAARTPPQAGDGGGRLALTRPRAPTLVQPPQQHQRQHAGQRARALAPQCVPRAHTARVIYIYIYIYIHTYIYIYIYTRT